MLSYMLPVSENTSVVNETDRLKLDLNQSPSSPERKVGAYHMSATSKDSSTSSFASSDNTGSSMTQNVSATTLQTKHKMLSNGNKLISFKRVSFGSSKGSMVETMIYETPLKEESESTTADSTKEDISSPTNTPNQVLERSKVRVSFYQGAKAQCVSPPPEETSSPPPYYVMGPVTDLQQQPHFDRQLSTESGWDNPFRPDGDLSREADEIVSLIKGGKPITPTPDVGHNDSYTNQNQGNKNISEIDSPVSKKTSQLTQQGVKVSNGTNGSGPTSGEHPPGHVVVQRSAPEGPQQPQHVTLKKKPKCKCCVIQ